MNMLLNFCVYVHKPSLIIKWNIGLAQKEAEKIRMVDRIHTTQFPAQINQRHKPYIVTPHSHMIFYTQLHR